MIWIVVIEIVGFILIRFFSDLNKDNTDLHAIFKVFNVLFLTNGNSVNGLSEISKYCNLGSEKRLFGISD